MAIWTCRKRSYISCRWIRCYTRLPAFHTCSVENIPFYTKDQFRSTAINTLFQVQITVEICQRIRRGSARWSWTVSSYENSPLFLRIWLVCVLPGSLVWKCTSHNQGHFLLFIKFDVKSIYRYLYVSFCKGQYHNFQLYWLSFRHLLRKL